MTAVAGESLPEEQDTLSDRFVLELFPKSFELLFNDPEHRPAFSKSTGTSAVAGSFKL